MRMVGNYWVYTHTCPNGMVYVGMSSQKYTCGRWQPYNYRTTSLQPYIEEYGWENIEHFFIDGIRTKESALKLENDLIQMYSDMGCCINKQVSGGISLDRKEYNKQYNKQYYEEHKQFYEEHNKQYYKKHKKERRKYYKEYYLKHKKQNQ